MKRPRRNDDLHVYYYWEFHLLVIYVISFLYTLLMFICAFYMVFCAACLAILCENSAVCLLCHDVAEVAHCLLNTTNIPSWG